MYIHNTLYYSGNIVGESGIDTGGPKREFLRLLASEASDSAYFRGGLEGFFFLAIQQDSRSVTFPVNSLQPLNLFCL